MKLIKVTNVDDQLLEHLCDCYCSVLAVGSEVVFPYYEEWEDELVEMEIDYTIVEI